MARRGEDSAVSSTGGGILRGQQGAEQRFSCWMAGLLVHDFVPDDQTGVLVSINGGNPIIVGISPLYSL